AGDRRKRPSEIVAERFVEIAPCRYPFIWIEDLAKAELKTVADLDAMKQAAARAAIAHVPDDSVVGVGTGSNVNFFIDELARIKGRIDAAVSSSRASTERLKRPGIRVLDLNSVDELPVYVGGADEKPPR